MTFHIYQLEFYFLSPPSIHLPTHHSQQIDFSYFLVLAVFTEQKAKMLESNGSFSFIKGLYLPKEILLSRKENGNIKSLQGEIQKKTFPVDREGERSVTSTERRGPGLAAYQPLGRHRSLGNGCRV